MSEKSLGEWRETIESDQGIRQLLDNGKGGSLGAILDQQFPKGDKTTIPRFGSNGSISADSLRNRIIDMGRTPYLSDKTRGPLQCYFLGKIAKILEDDYLEGYFETDE